MQHNNTLIAAGKIHILLICSANASKCLCDCVFPNLDDCQVSSAHNPEQALNLFKNYLYLNQPFDIVFMDYLLYRTNGITLARRLFVLHPAVKIEFFSSRFFKDKNIFVSYIELFGCFKKPVSDKNQVMEIINTIRREKKSNRKKRYAAKQ